MSAQSYILPDHPGQIRTFSFLSASALSLLRALLSHLLGILTNWPGLLTCALDLTSLVQGKPGIYTPLPANVIRRPFLTGWNLRYSALL